MKKSRKLSCHVVDSNIANGSLPTLGRNYFKRFIMESRFLPSSQISGRMYNRVGDFNVSNLMGITRRMIDIVKKITFYFLQNV